MPSDQNSSILINETLMKTLGWKEAIGKKMQFKRNAGSELATMTVIGVVKDFHTYSLQHRVEPLVMMMPASTGAQDNMYVKIARGKTAEGLAYLKKYMHSLIKPIRQNFISLMKILQDNTLPNKNRERFPWSSPYWPY
jgi:putative ABC transport system permease protein